MKTSKKIFFGSAEKKNFMAQNETTLHILQALSSRARKFETHFANMKASDLVVDIENEVWCVMYPDHEGNHQCINFTVTDDKISMIGHTACFHDAYGECPVLVMSNFFST